MSLHSNTSIDRSAVNGPVKGQNLGSLPIQPLANSCSTCIVNMNQNLQFAKRLRPIHIFNKYIISLTILFEKIEVATLRASALFSFSSSLFDPSLDRILKVEICDKESPNAIASLAANRKKWLAACYASASSG